MRVENGFVEWDSPEDEASFREMCVPHEWASLELHQFTAWLEGVIESHLSDGGGKLLYATFLAGLLPELLVATNALDGSRHLMLAERAMRDACRTPHERSSTRQIGNTRFLH